jgi:hypothetical protein
VTYPDRNMRAITNRPYGFQAKMNRFTQQPRPLAQKLISKLLCRALIDHL